MSSSRIAAALALVAGFLFLGTAPTSADEKPSRDGTTAEAGPTKRQGHTLYDDQGAIDWRPKVKEAIALAKRERKLIFIEWGRET